MLKSAKEPWARDVPRQATTRGDDVPVEKVGDEAKPDSAVTSVPSSSSLPKVLAGSAGGAGADTTADAEAKADADADKKI